MIQTIQLHGTDKQLYKIVAPLVMDPEVLKMNNNYPFKTTDKFIWFIAASGKHVVGFLPVERRGKEAIINNIDILEASVKKDNMLSRKIFINNGFFEIEENDKYLYLYFLKKEKEIV